MLPMPADSSDPRATARKQRTLGLVFALIAAAAFGGFAATALQLPWQPAQAPARATTAPVTARLTADLPARAGRPRR